MLKRVKIYPYQIGLVFEGKNFLNVLTEGSYWLWNKTVKIYDETQDFVPPMDLNILLENDYLASLLHIVEVADNELVFLYKNGNFNRILKPGRYAFWKGVVNYDFQVHNLEKLEIPESVDKKILMTYALGYIRVFPVESYEEGLLMVDGIFARKLKPGRYFFWKNEQNITVLKADLRVLQMEVSGQEILTKDKAALRINFQLQYKVNNIEKALIETKDVAKQLYLLMQMSIREYIGTLTLDELLAKKENIKDFIFEFAAEKANDLGCEIITCGIRDIILPGDVKEIMNQVLVAEKKAQANTIMRREETASTRSLLNTAKLMENNAMLWKLKEMEYVEKIADKVNSISVSGGGQVLDQLREIFVSEK